MIEIKIKISSDRFTQALNQLIDGLENRQDLMRNIAGTMESAVLTNFDQGGRPKWQGLKYREGMPLVDTENLMGSITSHYDNDNAIVGTNVAYAAIHHFGGKAGRGQKVDIPARPFLTLTPQDEDDIADGIQDYFRNLIK
ncbi:phage virion morphogenesis protein [Caviibacterium pharyngocola]|uniref:Phage virion morphogenesis protein n=1 Tax=Caviibacterium pharyngocola TaxID=28159 RepID=A0A2M8RY19_9PAST|nr:phage virion morphogenesis protein [Caviibacterium pharyngocola]PJG83775.1 phage virion morphogenesis protein [Caviibacterium pharyngocola]